MIRGKGIFLHCSDGMRPRLEQKARDLGASLVDSPKQAEVIYVVGHSAAAEEIASYKQSGKTVMHVNQDLIDPDLMGKLLSGRIRVRDSGRDR